MKEIEHELFKLEQDKKLFEQELLNEQLRLKEQFKGDFGNDIKNVLEHKTIIKLPFKRKLQYKIKTFFDKLFKLF